MSPAEVVIFPEVEIAPQLYARAPVVIRRGDYELFSERRMREIAAEYVEAQELALPVVADRWMERERRRQEKERAKQRNEGGDRPHPGLFD
jgi:hypothetical protein